MDVLVLACETASGFMRTLSLKRKNHAAGRSGSGWKEAHVATDFQGQGSGANCVTFQVQQY